MADEGKRLWLIDAAYLRRAQTSVGRGFRFDYLKLRTSIEAAGPIWRAYYLDASPNPAFDAQDQFHEWLRSGPPAGPKLVTKLFAERQSQADRAYCTRCQSKVGLTCPNGADHPIRYQHPKGVDVGLATLALIHHEHYETLVLSSGDGDLCEVVEHLSERGKHIELLVFKQGVATELQSRADAIRWIDDFASEVLADPATSG